MTMALAVRMNRTPAEIDAMTYLDSLTFLEAGAKADRAGREFDAALHGRTLKKA